MDSRQVTERLSAEIIVPNFENQQFDNPQDSSTLFIAHIESKNITIRNTSANSTIKITDRLQCITWAYYTMVMAAGGVTEAVYTMPFIVKPLEVLGDIFLMMSIALFVVVTAAIGTRFSSRSGAFQESFMTQGESLFIAASVVAAGVTLLNIIEHGIPASGQWLQSLFIALFWVYAALSFFSSIIIYVYIWSTQQFQLSDMSPIWIFPAYPLLLVGPLATALLNQISLYPSPNPLQTHPKLLVFTALELQGIGFLLAITIYCIFVFRLMAHGLPRPQLSPSFFITVGPLAFTSTSLLQLGHLSSFIIPNNPNVTSTIQTLAYSCGAGLWGLAVWYFMLSVSGQWRALSQGIKFDITFFAYVFPNSALVSATHAVGKVFAFYPLQIFGCILSIILIVAYVAIFVKTIMAVWQKKLLWPQSAE